MRCLTAALAIIPALLQTVSALPAPVHRESNGINHHPQGHLRRGHRQHHKHTPVNPGHAEDLIITHKNTVNGTSIGKNHRKHKPAKDFPASAELPLAFVNNLSGGAVKAYVTGLDDSNQAVFLLADGSFYYPTAGGSTTPVPITEDVSIPLESSGSTLKISIPGYISAGRIWFAEGDLTFFMVAGADGGESIVEPSAVNLQDPSADINWGFVELTNTEDGGLYANISYVDFVGLILGMELLGSDGTQTTKGLSADAVSSICGDLTTQTGSDGQPWDKLCVAGTDGNPLRVLAPTDYGTEDDTAFADYWNSYVDKVWAHYTGSNNSTLTINTQADAGMVSCSIADGETLTCAGDNRGYAKPTAADIWGCNSGPFGIEADDNDVHKAVVPRLCAAFVRSTLLLAGGQTQPGLASDKYYTTAPTNHYSRIVHSYESDGKGYAFAYDDVNPDNDTNQSGVVADPEPQLLTIFVGGASS